VGCGFAATAQHHRGGQNVRAIADEWLQSDPRFAQELYCAANRHELASRNASPSRF